MTRLASVVVTGLPHRVTERGIVAKHFSSGMEISKFTAICLRSRGLGVVKRAVVVLLASHMHFGRPPESHPQYGEAKDFLFQPLGEVVVSSDWGSDGATTQIPSHLHRGGAPHNLASGGKAADQGERRPASHASDTERNARVPGLGGVCQKAC